MPLATPDLIKAVKVLAALLQSRQVKFSISGGAASALLRIHYGIDTRTTDDIDLVVQPNGNVNAETISKWLYENFPGDIGKKNVYGHIIPTVRVGAKVQVDIEMFDVQAWPNRRQYDLDREDNEQITISIDGANIPIFGPRWQLREKIVTAYERQGSGKEETDFDDAEALLDFVADRSVDLSHYPEAVTHMLNSRPHLGALLKQKIVCPKVLG